MRDERPVRLLHIELRTLQALVPLGIKLDDGERRALLRVGEAHAHSLARVLAGDHEMVLFSVDGVALGGGELLHVVLAIQYTRELDASVIVRPIRGHLIARLREQPVLGPVHGHLRVGARLVGAGLHDGDRRGLLAVRHAQHAADLHGLHRAFRVGRIHREAQGPRQKLVASALGLGEAVAAPIQVLDEDLASLIGGVGASLNREPKPAGILRKLESSPRYRLCRGGVALHEQGVRLGALVGHSHGGLLLVVLNGSLGGYDVAGRRRGLHDTIGAERNFLYLCLAQAVGGHSLGDLRPVGGDNIEGGPGELAPGDRIGLGDLDGAHFVQKAQGRGHRLDGHRPDLLARVGVHDHKCGGVPVLCLRAHEGLVLGRLHVNERVHERAGGHGLAGK